MISGSSMWVWHLTQIHAFKHTRTHTLLRVHSSVIYSTSSMPLSGSSLAEVAAVRVGCRLAGAGGGGSRLGSGFVISEWEVMHVGQSHGGSKGFTVKRGCILYFYLCTPARKGYQNETEVLRSKLYWRCFIEISCSTLGKKLDKLTHWFLSQAEFYP